MHRVFQGGVEVLSSISQVTVGGYTVFESSNVISQQESVCKLYCLTFFSGPYANLISHSFGEGVFQLATDMSD